MTDLTKENIAFETKHMNPDFYEPVPAELEIIAKTGDEIMGLKHRQHPTYGVQFHPESILTEHGKQLLKNFLDIKLTPAPST